ncbi:MAG TPA: cytochrome c [Anaerolineales bacterium]|nr:cytochrome c [Anaerolineales bacterium]
MINRSSILNRWIALLLAMLLAIPLLGWNALPKLVSRGAIEDRGAFTNVTTQSISSQAASAGNIETGQKLFMGYVHFQNGGPPCMGCHSVGQNGLLGGGAMGPDLTNVSTRRGDLEILGILSNTGEIISPVMQPIYKDFPLTAQEQADLLAFVKSSAGQPESNKELLVLGISLAGFVAAVVVLGFIYRGRLRGVRKALVRKAQAKK